MTPLDSVPRWEAVEWGAPVRIGAGRTAVRVSPGDMGTVRRAVKRGMAPLTAYERYGAF